MPTGTLSGKGKELADDGKWVRGKSEFDIDAIREFSMAIVKASREKSDGTMRIRLVNSDTGEDVFGERMSFELFQDFVRRNDENLPVPAPFDKVIEKMERGYWKGGAPYLSVSHYRSGGGKNIPGEQEKLYIDGEKLKSVDTLWDTPLGNAVWRSIYNDLYEEDKSYENPVRVSIGFLDLEHKHEGANEDGSDFIFTRTNLKETCPSCDEGVGNKVYLKGHLVHKAFTRVPANVRTLVEVDKMAKAIISKKDDARSIIEDLADELEEKSTAENILVIKSEKDLQVYAYEVSNAFEKAFGPPPQPRLWVSGVTDKSVIVVIYEHSSDEESIAHLYKVGYKDVDGKFTFDERSKWVEVEYGLIPKKSEVQENEWEVKFDEKPVVQTDKSEVDMDEKEKEVQKKEEEVVEVPVETTEPKVELSAVEKAARDLEVKVTELKTKGKYGEDALRDVQESFNALGEVVKTELAVPAGQVDMVAVIKSAISEVVPVLKQEIVAQLVTELKGMVSTQAPKLDNVQVARSLTLSALPPTGEDKRTQIEKIAYKSVGL